MIQRPAASPAREFIVATEVGILHRLQRAYPDKTFYAANERASCAYMKVTTMPTLLDAILKNQHRITVDRAVSSRAQRAIDRMVSIGGTTPTPAGPGVDPGE